MENERIQELERKVADVKRMADEKKVADARATEQRNSSNRTAIQKTSDKGPTRLANMPPSIDSIAARYRTEEDVDDFDLESAEEAAAVRSMIREDTEIAAQWTSNAIRLTEDEADIQRFTKATKRISRSQLMRVTPDDFTFMSSDAIRGINELQLSFLTPDQVHAIIGRPRILTQVQLGYLSSRQLGRLSTMQLQSLTSGDISEIDTEQEITGKMLVGLTQKHRRMQIKAAAGRNDAQGRNETIRAQLPEVRPASMMDPILAQHGTVIYPTTSKTMSGTTIVHKKYTIKPTTDEDADNERHHEEVDVYAEQQTDVVQIKSKIDRINKYPADRSTTDKYLQKCLDIMDPLTTAAKELEYRGDAEPFSRHATAE